MTTTNKEITDLVSEHEIIRSNMKLLINLLKNLSKQSKRGNTSSTELKKQISLFRWLLYGFQEVIRQHIEMDESIFKMLHGGALAEEVSLEHEEIICQIDNIIRLAENSTSYELKREVLKRCAFDISEEVKRICELIGEHMTREDISLRKESAAD